MSELQCFIPAAYFQETAATLDQDVGNQGVIAGFTVNDEDFYGVLLFWWRELPEVPKRGAREVSGERDRLFCEKLLSFETVKAVISCGRNITYSSSPGVENVASDNLIST